MVGAAALVLLYYVAMPVIGPHFLHVCHKGKYGPPDECSSWDALTAIALRVFYFLDEHNGTISAIASVAVAGFTAVLWWSTDKLWTEARAQQELTRESVKASVASAEAAAKAADISERSLKSLETPYIYPSPVFKPDDPNETILVTLKNYGRSPATVTEVRVGFHITPANVFNQKALAEHTRNFMADTVIGDKEESDPFYFTDPALPQYKALILDGRYSLNLFVTASWRSAVGGDQTYMRRFIWHPRYKRFVAGVQVWDELPTNRGSAR